MSKAGKQAFAVILYCPFYIIYFCFFCIVLFYPWLIPNVYLTHLFIKLNSTQELHFKNCLIVIIKNKVSDTGLP